MSNFLPFLRKCLGLNNVRRRQDFFIGENGEMWLSKAVNIDVTDDAGIERRSGYSEVVTGACHSAFSHKGVLYFVKDDVLTSYENGAFVSICAVKGKVFYAVAGAFVYIMNSGGFKKIFEGIALNLSSSEIGFETSFHGAANMIRGEFLEIWAGKAWCGVDDVLWYSEPFNYGTYDPARNFVSMPGEVSGIKGIRTGLYVGTSNGVVYLHGTDVNKFSYNVVETEPVIPGSMVLIDGSLLKGLNVFEKVVLYATKKGYRVCGPDGFYYELNEDNLAIPYGRGNGFVHNKNYFLSIDG